jgi:hypothetical protein
MIRLLGLALIVLLSACGGDNGSGPNEESLEGTWVGDYTNTASPGVVFQGVLQLSQDGEQVTGTLTTNAGRSATVSGSVSGDRLDATFTYTDGCDGTATTTADLVDERVPPELTGNYTSTDCVGETAGGYSLVKQ